MTDNRAKKLVAAKKSPLDVHAVIYIPNKRARGNPKRLRAMSKTFERAWNMALSGDYWNAMILNGVAASATLNTDPGLVGKMIGAGALGASVSGNGPAFAAIARKKDLARVKRQFPKLQGRIITVHKLQKGERPVMLKGTCIIVCPQVMLTPAFMDASTPARITFASTIFL